MRGRFVVMEGPDGSGKSTQTGLLEEYLKENKKEYIITREPGGTRIGEAIRGIILNPEYREMSDVTEMLLYAASRAQLMKDVIIPALEEGKVVISDRFVDSSMVYQGIARGLGAQVVSAVNAPGIGDHRPDRVFFIDIPEEEGLRRKKEQKKLDRLEQESIDFHQLVSRGYREVLARRPEVLKIDGMLPVEEIQRIIRREMDLLLK
ncbi:MAG: dTMP kinase [Eubacterium sp.]|nr:dTMP kinase [Eubacterium sp.]